LSVIDNNKPKVVFVGDTSLRTSHFGCQLVGQTFREQFSRVGLELTASLPTKFEQVSNWKKYLKEASLVVINGEGSIHHGRFQNLIDLSDKYPCVLVNCVYQENPFNEHLKGFKYISTRESLSLQELKKNDVTAEVVPDVLFASTFLRSFVPTSKVVHDVGYTDCSQKEQWSFGPFSFRYRPGFSPKTSIVADYLNYLCSHKKNCYWEISCSSLLFCFGYSIFYMGFKYLEDKRSYV
jgi:hypothetical protein